MADATGRRNLIIKAGDKLPSLSHRAGDFEQWLMAGLGWSEGETDVVAVFRDETLPPCEGVAAVVITGSGAMVTDGSAWIDSTARWLTDSTAVGIPTLGVCFGHQLLAHALGGTVANNPRGVEVGSIEVVLETTAQTDPLLGELPQTFPAQLTHMQSVVVLPPGAVLLAHSEMEPVEAFRYGEWIWGVQFHPEFDEEIVGAYIDYYRDAEAIDSERAAVLRSTRHPTPQSAALLAQFSAIAKSAFHQE